MQRNFIDGYDCGIYNIRCLVNQHGYLGSTIKFKRRFHAHRSELRGQRHVNSHLQRAFNKYGEENFIFEVVMVCSKEMLNFYEELLIKRLHPDYNNTFSECHRGAPRRAAVWTPELKEQVRRKLVGRIVSDETRKLQSESIRKVVKHYTAEGLKRLSDLRKADWAAGRFTGPPFVDQTGRKLLNATVLSYAGKGRRQNGNPQHMWNCQCNCGKVFTKSAAALSRVKGCGCGRGKHRTPKPNVNLRSTNKTGVIGVSISRGQFLARVTIESVRIRLGYFPTIDAATAAISERKRAAEVAALVFKPQEQVS